MGQGWDDEADAEGPMGQGGDDEADDGGPMGQGGNYEAEEGVESSISSQLYRVDK